LKSIHRPTGTKWWPLLGFSQSTARSCLVRVSAAATAEGRDGLAGTDPYAQTVQAIANLGVALAALGAGPQHVIRTRIYVIDTVHWPAIARAYGEAFPELGPENRVIGTRQFACPDSLMEIEADAVVPHDRLRDRGRDPRRRVAGAGAAPRFVPALAQ
jgi:enamine deaminase RidA (YjgF/YER057c/UK114 family)